MEKNALNMLKKHNSGAFKYILHNLYDQLRNYDSSLAEQIYEKFKYYEICAVDDGDEEIYEKGISFDSYADACRNGLDADPSGGSEGDTQRCEGGRS